MADTNSSNPSPKRIAVVTGGNKGIGFEICRQLASKGVQVVLTARDETRGLGAVERLKADGISDVVFHQLEVTDLTSIASLVDFLETHFGKLDILVNNAAIGGLSLDYNVLGITEGTPVPPDRETIRKAARETYEDAEKCVETNYYGVRKVTEALIPLLKLSHSARVVIVSSIYGRLRFIANQTIRNELDNVASLTEERIDELLRNFLEDFRDRKLKESGWPTFMSAYTVSKVHLCSYARMLAIKHPELVINCVNPGHVKTDINWNVGTLSVEVGARGPVMLALLPDGSLSGLFYEQTKVSSYD